jgi:hypothetical protein
VNKKYLWVRPRGGLNDVLCQFEACREYAYKTGRTIVVSTETASTDSHFAFVGKFSTLLSNDKGLKKMPGIEDNLPASFDNSVSVNPATAVGHIEVLRDKSWCKISGSSPKKQLTFDFNRKFTEELSIHEDAGGGLRLANAFRYLRVTVEVTQQLRIMRTALLKQSVTTAIHIRHRDLKSSHPDLTRLLNSEIRVFACSDEEDMDGYLKTNFPHLEFLRPSDLSEEFDSQPVTSKALLELFCLGFCERLIVVPLDSETSQASLGNGARYSGFARLAKFVWLTSNTSGLKDFRNLVRKDSLKGVAGGKTFISNLGFWLLFGIPLLIKISSKRTGVYLDLYDLKSETQASA